MYAYASKLFWPHLDLLELLELHPTGCKSQFRKIFEFKIWKEPMLALKQMIPKLKAL